MNYLISYSDDNNNIIKEIHYTAAISLAQVHANLIAYKLNRKVLNVKVYDYRIKLLETLKDNNKDNIIKTLTLFNEDEYCTLNDLEHLAINDGIRFNKLEEKYNINQELIIEDYIIKLNGHYNAYGLIILDNLNIYINNKLIIREEFKDGKKRAV